MFHGSKEQASHDATPMNQIEDSKMNGEVHRLVSCLNLPLSLIKDTMVFHYFINKNEGVESSPRNISLASASLLFIVCKARGCTVHVSRFLDASNTSPVQFRRAILGLSRAVKVSHVEHQLKKVVYA